MNPNEKTPRPEFAPARIFLKGLVTVVPAALTLYLLIASCIMAENLTGSWMRRLLPDGWYLPGMGLLSGITFIFGVGLLMHFWLFERFFQWSERQLERVPLVKSIYGMTRDFLGFFAEKKKREFSQVVMVSMPDSEMKLFGLVSRTTFDDLPSGIGGEDTVAVYLPMSYQIGGYTVYLPRSRVTPIDMKLEAAMRFALTAGVSRLDDHAPPAPPRRDR